MRELSLDETIAILKDPWQAIVVDPMSDDSFIASQGDEWELKEEIALSPVVFDNLNKLREDNVIYYSDFHLTKQDNRVITPHFFDIWREEAYGIQPANAVDRAKQIGLIS